MSHVVTVECDCCGEAVELVRPVCHDCTDTLADVDRVKLA